MIFRNLRTALIILMAALLAAGCQKDECDSGCTVVQGRFVTGNGQEPLKGLKIKVEWFKSYGFFGRTDVRGKATAVTDANGSYTLRYQLKADEINEGHLTAEVDDRYYYGARYAHVPLPQRPDTAVIAPDFWLPRPAQLAIELVNPEAVQAKESIGISLFFLPGPAPAPLNGTSVSFGSPQISGTRFREQVEVPAEQRIRIVIVKYRDYSYTPFSTTTDSLILTRNETRRYPVSF